MYAFSANWVKMLKNKSSLELAFSSIAVASIICFFMILLGVLIFDDFISLTISQVTANSLMSATILGFFALA